MNINGTTKSINERVEDLEDYYENAKELAELTKEEMSDKIVFGRMYIGSVEEFVKSLKTIDDIKLHIQMLEPLSAEYEKGFNSVVSFSEKGNELKTMIVENSQFAKNNKDLSDRLIVLLEHYFSEWDEFANNLIDFLKN